MIKVKSFFIKICFIVLVLLLLFAAVYIVWIKIPSNESGKKTLTKENILHALTVISEDFGYGKNSVEPTSSINNQNINCFAESGFESYFGIEESLYIPANEEITE